MVSAGLVSAGFGRRFAALIYDSFLLFGLLMVFTGVLLVFTRRALLPETFGAWAYLYRAGLVGVIAGYYILNWMRSGQTLGMRAWRLRTVADTGERVSGRAAVMRFVYGSLAWPPAALGVLWLYVDPDHLAIHDRLSKTRVVGWPG
ncbi:MAG: RDD family protein [Pseudomonadota bacterium]|nr:RDD family protein [Pseudomonadota bacterium]